MAFETKFPFSPFTFAAKQLESVATRPGCWNVSRVGIFRVPIVTDEKDDDDKLEWGHAQLIGEYTYNYSFNPKRFYAFRRAGQWYALYSKDYTATRIMRIFEKDGQWTWEDWCGQESDSYGFCPAEFYVPQNHGLYSKEIPADKCLLTVDEELQDWGHGEDWTVEVYRPDFGFVAGCVWGDDNSWKLQFIDLSQIEDKIYKQEERFGYLELPGMDLRDLIGTECTSYKCGYNRRIIKISGLTFDFDSGELLPDGLKIAKANHKEKNGQDKDERASQD